MNNLRRALPALVCICLAALSPDPAAAQAAKQGNDPLDRLTRSDARLRAAPVSEPIDRIGTSLAVEVRNGWEGFLASAPGAWHGYVDRRTGRLEVAEGAGIPWIPGRGNTLQGGEADLAALERTARTFLPGIERLLGVSPRELVLNRGRSGRMDDSLWLVDFDVHRGGMPIEGARVVFRVSQGNLVQIGTENLPAPGTPVPPVRVEAKDAVDAVAEYVGGLGATDMILDSGSLHLLPANLQDDGETEGFGFARGRGLIAAWQVIFWRRGVLGTWRGRVDATTGELLDFVDLNRYGEATGGVYPQSYVFADETVLPMPFADLSTGGYTSSAGLFNFTGGPISSTLNGQYVRVVDTCGPISLNASGTGRISFGTSSGTDCTTPGSGGSGNTHASRMQFYQVNRAKEVSRGWFPTNSWVNGQLRANVNIFDVCNAYWDFSAINFFRSGAGCGNTGEIAGVALHEYGHALDSNDGNGGSPDLGTAETYGDFTAALADHDSCVGPGFYGGNCDGFGDACTSCTGIRDIDWAQHTSNAPHTVTNFTQPFCYADSYAGPCGREGHCESHISSEALWDFVERDFPDPGSAAAWAVVDRLWHLSRPTATSAFTCSTGTSPWTSDGCAAGSLWRTMRAADDDDGNLANGTPHSCHLFAAFNRHGIACASDPGANVCFSGCTPPDVPTLSLTPGEHQVQVGWSDSGPGVVYDVFRNEVGCDAGFAKVADNLAGASFTDTGVAGDRTYFYQVIAHPSGNGACAAVPTACQSVTPTVPDCPAVPAPTGLAVAPAGVGLLGLSWNAVSGATAYIVYRGTVAGGPYTEVASVPGTAYTDAGLASDTLYYYVVRAFAGCESEASSEVSARTYPCTDESLYSNDFESGIADWTTGTVSGTVGPADWRGITACAAHSGGSVFRFGGAAGCDASYASSQHTYAAPLGETGIAVPTGSGRTRLSFWHRWSFEYGFDGGYLSLSLDGGYPVDVPATALTGASYNAGSYISSHLIFSSTQSSFVQTVADLDSVCNTITGTNGGCAGHTLVIRFNTIIDGSVTYPGWYLDDVSVTVCRARGCTGAPVIGTATASAANEVQVTWTNGSPASSSFNVYRAAGSCATPGPFTRIATALPGSPSTDPGVSGGSTYAYQVTGLDAGGICESLPSGCVQATATGECRLPPTFAGLAAASDGHGGSCSVDLSWQPATSPCGRPVAYNVYRSTLPGFAPAAANRIAAGVAGASYRDFDRLDYTTTYYYVVRAVDAVTGMEETNLVRKSAAPTGPPTEVTTTDTFEGFQSGWGFDLPGWQHISLSGGNDWYWTSSRYRSPFDSWYSPSQPFPADRVLISPSFNAGLNTRLTFWHTYQFESCWDGGTLEISTNGGTTWSTIPGTAFQAGGYNGTITPSGNPISGKPAWCGGQLGQFTQVVVSLAAWAGQTARVRWHAGEDESNAQPGWFVDDVTFENTHTYGTCLRNEALSFYTLPPCRAVDTRNPVGPLGSPALAASQFRTFQLAGVCGIPATARAVSANLTVTQGDAAGFLIAFPTGQTPPVASTMNFLAGSTRANNAVLGLGSSATGPVTLYNGSNGKVHLIIDVNGYFAPSTP